MKNFFYALIIAFVVASLIILRGDIFQLWEKFWSVEQISQPEIPPAVKTETAAAPLPKPLPKPQPSVSGALKVVKPAFTLAVNLDVAKIAEITNRERVRAGLPPLSLNNQLASSALIKAEDMLARQYFEHTAPDGRGVSDLAADAGYEYLALGENLAMGDFSSEADLVSAWMASPGHRANILSPRFTEIGGGVRKGSFGKRVVWLAVQHFGRPLSACPAMDEALKDEIEADQVRLDSLGRDLELKKAEIDSEPPFGSEYEADVEEYNSMVKIYNDLVQKVKSNINAYNQGVRAFNACVGSI